VSPTTIILDLSGIATLAMKGVHHGLGGSGAANTARHDTAGCSTNPRQQSDAYQDGHPFSLLLGVRKLGSGNEIGQEATIDLDLLSLVVQTHWRL
jgi:hypothetical protein